MPLSSEVRTRLRRVSDQAMVQRAGCSLQQQQVLHVAAEELKKRIARFGLRISLLQGRSIESLDASLENKISDEVREEVT